MQQTSGDIQFSTRTTAIKSAPDRNNMLSRSGKRNGENSKMKCPRLIFRALHIVVLIATSVSADQLTVEQGDVKREGRRPSIIVPYAFSTEALETGLGAVYFRKGVFQPHDGLFVTGYGTSNTYSCRRGYSSAPRLVS
jgi:hypothetical protein